jgi:uroporphyrinogen decarboxylase
MNGMERLQAAVNKTPADRIPIFCNLLEQGMRELAMPAREYYASGENIATAQLQMRKKYGYDNLWSLFYVGREAQLLGCRHIVYAEDGPPNVGDMVIRTLEDIERLEVPASVLEHPLFAEERICLDILRREAGGKYPICAYITATMTLPAILMGMEKWLPLLINGPVPERDHLLALCHDFFVKEVAAYRAAGADILLYSNPFGSLDMIPKTFFEQQSLAWIKKDFAAVGTSDLVYYCGGARMNPVLDRICRETQIGSYFLGPQDDVAEGKAQIAGRGLCCGIINDIPLIDWTPQQVREEVRRLIAAGKPGGQFLFGTLLMPCAIPEANIRALMEAALEFGRWP